MLRAVIAVLIFKQVLGGDVSSELIGASPSPVQFNPWVASVEKNGAHVCGASIITKRALLSTASCTPKYNSSSRLSVRVGSSSSSVGGSLLDVVYVFFHEDYGGDPSASGNVALLRLNEPMNFTANVAAIRRADRDTQVGSFVYALGWAEPESGENGTKQIWRSYMRIVDSNSCGSDKAPSTNSSDFSSSNSSKTAAIRLCSAQHCQGNRSLTDSGGSLVDQKMQLIGIITNKINCTEPGIQVEYVKIFEYRKWIDEHKNKIIPTTTMPTPNTTIIPTTPNPDSQYNMKNYGFIWKMFIFFLILLASSVRFRIYQISDQ